MKLVDLTLPTPAENLACDEALLDWCDETGGEALRFWEPTQYFVVVGYANKVATEADPRACDAQGVGIFRRCSGGGTVLQGPGCLNYSLGLQVPEHGPLASVTGTNRFIMERNRAALEEVLGRPVAVRGHTDLVLGDRKFSGNAQRRKRRALLFHGSFLCCFDLPRIEQFLRFPSQQPAYRRGRVHRDFLVNLAVPANQIKTALRQAWQARGELGRDWLPVLQRLVTEKYARADWNRKF